MILLGSAEGHGAESGPGLTWEKYPRQEEAPAIAWVQFPRQRAIDSFSRFLAHRMRPSDRPTPHSPPPLAGPLRRLLRPLVRLLMQSGITFPVFADLLRSLYVEVAVRDLLKDSRARTDSRISLLTGVHRKEIRRQREAGTEAEEAPGTVTLGSQIIGRWLGLAAYTDARGRPLVLPRASTSRRKPSFDGLVRSITTDVRPRAVLEDLESQGLVVREAEDRVRLNVAAFVPRPGRAEQLFYFGRNLADHIAAAAANVLAPAAPPAVGQAPAPFLERSVHYDRLTAAAALRLVAGGREAAGRLLVDFNRLALAGAEAGDRAAAKRRLPRRSRVNLGIYLYHEDDEPKGEES